MVTLQNGRIHMFLKLFSCLFVIEKSCWFHNNIIIRKFNIYLLDFVTYT